jgi:hypothetical protein
MINCVCKELLRIYGINARRINAEIYRVSHLRWNPPQQHASAAVSELLGNDLVTTLNIAVAC